LIDPFIAFQLLAEMILLIDFNKVFFCIESGGMILPVSLFACHQG